jgi:chemotaxis protein methyltransferase CheR
MTTETEDLEVRLLLDAIHARYGYDLREYDPVSMGRRVRAVLSRTGLAHLGELQHRVLHEPAFFGSILDDLTVQVTEMFRDPSFYRSFRQRVIPTLRTYPQLKIWHAGCASGEEVYATAIMLMEEDLYDRTQIYATDVSEGALEKAREAVYGERQALSFEESYRLSGGTRRFDDYWSRAYGHAAIRENLCKNIVFFQHNLVTDYALGEMHVIFCRNVLIYFGPRLRERVFGIFADSLCRGGFLCLGTSEHLPQAVGRRFAPLIPGEQIYRARGDS